MQMQRIMRFCPICNNSPYSISPLYSNSMASIDDIDLSYIVASCLRCGSVYATALADNDVYTRYYERYSKYDTCQHLSREDCAVHQSIAEIIAENCNRTLTVCDIGCGYGHLLNDLKQHGFSKLCGVDPSPNAANKAKAQYGLCDIHHGFIDTVDESLLRDVDVILLTWVLEHLQSPISSIQTIISKVKPRCKILIAVPDISCFNGKSGEPLGEFSLEHINYFSEASLCNLLTNCGLNVKYTSKFTSHLSGTLIVLAEAGIPNKTIKNNVCFSTFDYDSNVIHTYIHDSIARINKITKKIKDVIRGDFLIYGAGAHTARLLPMLPDDITSMCKGIVDNNPNLHDSKMFGINIFSSSHIKDYSGFQILISSFKSEEAIAKNISDDFDTITLYQEH